MQRQAELEMKREEIDDLMFSIVRKIIFDASLTKQDYEKGIDSPLTGTYWNLDAVQLAYLFCEVEKIFHVQFAPKNLVHYRFITINKVINQIVSLLPASI